MPILFTTDTGASKTIISDRLYRKMSASKRPRLVESASLISAGGEPLRELGKGTFNITLGQLSIQKEIVVAEIEDEGLLGMDILQDEEFGPADILLSQGVIKMRESDIPCIQIDQRDILRRVELQEDYVIPGYSEAIVAVTVERAEIDEISGNTEFLIEPTYQFKETFPLQMASAVIDTSVDSVSNVRLLNPLPTEVRLRKNTVVGRAEVILEEPVTLFSQERHKAGEENQSVRRIQLEKGDIKPMSSRKSTRAAGATDVPDHLKNLFSAATKGKQESETKVVAELLAKYQDVFSKGEWDIGLTHLAEHAIDTGNAAPIKQPPRRVPLAYQADEKKAIEELLEKKVARKSTSPWASPIVLVRKKSGQIRPCIDYRRVNKLVKPDGFPLPRIQDCLDAVAGSSLFSTFDLTSGYFQIPVKKEDIPKTAFACKFGQFEMTRMPFGLNNSGSTFQRTMELALQGLQWETCLIYIDDIIIFSSNFDEHMERVEQVLQRMREAGLKLKPEKCQMLQEEVTFLGHVVSEKGVQPNPTNVAKIMEWPVPKTPKQVRQFVAMGSYYRRFIKDFAKLVRPMVDLTKKGCRFIWSAACDESFRKLKEALVSSDVMGYPLNEGGEFILDTDASDVALGAVLSQIQDGRERVIAYASRAMAKAEKNYCVTEKELLAVRYFIEYFRQYLLGRKFLVRTDHQALVWLFSLKEPSGKVARWLEILAQYDFAIQYRPGKKQSHCDALSRCENPRDCDCPSFDMSEPLKCGPCKKCTRRAVTMMLQGKYGSIELPQSKRLDAEKRKDQEAVHTETARAVDSPTSPVPGTSRQESKTEDVKMSWSLGGSQSRSQLQDAQLEDPDIGPILKAKRENQKPCPKDMQTKSPASRHYWVLWDSLKVVDGVLVKVFTKQDLTGTFQQILVPRKFKNEVLFQMHNTLLSAHLGIKKTKDRILQRFYWYALKEDVTVYVRQCDVCAIDKKPCKTPKAPMGSLSAGAPWDHVAVDYIGPLPLTPRGNRYILVVTDHFTKYVEILPVPDQTAEVCASRLANDFISRWGCPLAIHSDQGRTFESKVFKELMRMMEIRKTRTSARNPKGNGQCERFNRTLIKMIKAYLSDQQIDWDLHLGCLAGAYRATPNESTKLTPNLLTFGREIRLPAELLFGTSSTAGGGEVTSYGDHVDTIRSRMQHAHDIARKHLGEAAKRRKDTYDTSTAFRNYHVGSVVWCLNETRKPGVTHKLEHLYEGPFLVTSKLSDINFVLQLDKRGTERVVHHDKIKPYEGANVPKWIVRAKQKLPTRQQD